MFNTTDCVFVLLIMLRSLQDTCAASDDFLRQHIGCFKDNNTNRAMGHPVVTNKTGMTIELCSQVCRKNRSTFFGVQFRIECMCGDNYDKHGTSHGCNRTCSGNSAQICGGGGAFNAYWVCPEGSHGSHCNQSCHCLNSTRYGEHCFRNGTCPAGCQPGWIGTTCADDVRQRYVGCYRDNNDARAMGQYVMESDSMTIELCSQRCRDINASTFFGVQYSRECMCGENYDKHGQASNCNMTCRGKPSETCGGESALDVYWVCREGLFGPRCNRSCYCLNNTRYGQHCFRNGTCPNGCQQGWTGTTCADIDECHSDPCENGGTCSDQVNGYSCSCASGYTGVNCETDIDECLSNPCENGGTCSDQVNGYTCSCVSGYTGVNCENDIDECHSNPCENGGTCSDQVNGYNCSCVSGYTSVNCETDIDECHSDPCENGGTCSDQVNGYNCSCVSGYTGVNCEIAGEGGGNLTPVILSVIILLLVTGAVIVCIVVRRRRSNEQLPASTNNSIDTAESVGSVEGSVQNRQRTMAFSVLNGKHASNYEDPRESEIDTSPIYANLVTDNMSSSSTRVKVADLPELVARINMMPNLLEAEFKQLPLVSDDKRDFAQNMQLKRKNRFKNILPYDKNRVKLSMIGTDQLTTYINASFIKSYGEGEKLIASHGPTVNTLDDFWRMIWEYNVDVIVMVTRCQEEMKVKCEQYWSETCEMEFGGMNVELVSVSERPEYVVRKLQVLKVGEPPRQITQAQFVDWPDHGVPEHAVSLLAVRRLVRRTACNNQYTIIHCSAGVGRTGTYLAIDYLLNQAAKEGFVDVHSCVKELRDQRMHSVQTLDQYSFIFKAILEGLTLGETTQSLTTFKDHIAKLRSINSITKKTILDTEFEMLQQMAPLPQPSDCADAMSEINKDKNRNPDRLPMDRRRVYLQQSKGKTDYINAVYVTSFRRKNAFICTQLPLKETVGDFWNMCVDHKCKVIVFLCTAGQAQDVFSFLPPDGASLKYDNVSVYGPSSPETDRNVNIDLLTVAATLSDQTENIYANTQNGGEDRVTIVRLTVPDSRPEIRIALGRVHDIVVSLTAATASKTSSPVIVMSRDGVQHCGQFIAVSNLCDMINDQQEVDVFQTVSNVKRAQPHFFANMGEYEEIYKIAETYTESSTIYYNT